MRIRDIDIGALLTRTNWRLVDADSFGEFEHPLEELEIEVPAKFSEDDYVVYSCLSALETGEVRPLVMIKRVGDFDYGGDYCEVVNGAWRQVGLEPDPNAPFGQEYVANPLEIDPSFDSDDGDRYRDEHRDGFLAASSRLERR